MILSKQQRAAIVDSIVLFGIFYLLGMGIGGMALAVAVFLLGH